MKKEDLVEITLAMVSLDKHYQSLTSYALASEKKREKIDKAVAKLIKLIHHSDEYCVDHESAMFVINQLNESKVDRLYRPNIYFMSNVSGGITEPPKEFGITQTEEIKPSNTSIDHIIDDKQLKLVARRYGFDFDDAVKAILKEANKEKLSAVKFDGLCGTDKQADSSSAIREVGTVVYVIELRSFRLKYNYNTERYIPTKSITSTDRSDCDTDPKINLKNTSKLVIECKIENGAELINLAKNYCLNISDMIKWIRETADQNEIKPAIYKGKIITLEGLEGKSEGEVYYCATSRKLYMKYGTGRNSYIASPKF